MTSKVRPLAGPGCRPKRLSKRRGGVPSPSLGDPLLGSPEENCSNYLSLLFRGAKKEAAQRWKTLTCIYLLTPSSLSSFTFAAAAASVYCFAHFWFGARQVGVKSASGRRLWREGRNGGLSLSPSTLAGEENLGAGPALKEERARGWILCTHSSYIQDV